MTTAKIAALSKTEDTGLTADLAAKLWSRLGSGLMAVVELVVDEHTEDREGVLGVKLKIAILEPAIDDGHEEYLRDLARGLYLRRQPKGIPGTEGESTDDIVRRGKNTILTGDDESDGPWPGDPDYTPADGVLADA